MPKFENCKEDVEEEQEHQLGGGKVDDVQHHVDEVRLAQAQQVLS